MTQFNTATEKFLADIALYGKVKCIRSDIGTELMGKNYQRHYSVKIGSDMKPQPHTHHTRMVLLKKLAHTI